MFQPLLQIFCYLLRTSSSTKMTHLNTNRRCSKHRTLFVILDFHREVDEICALLGCYVAYNDKFLPTFRDNIFSWIS